MIRRPSSPVFRYPALLLILALGLSLTLSAAAAATDTGYLLRRAKEKTVTDGVTLRQASFFKDMGDLPPLRQRLLLLNIDPAQNSRLLWRVVYPTKGIHARQKPSVSTQQLKGVKKLAALNGDFFDVAVGGALGACMQDGIWLQSPEFPAFPVLAFLPDGSARLMKPDMRLSISVMRGEQSIVEHAPIDALNQQRSDIPAALSMPDNAFQARQDNHAVLYTRAFSTATRQPDGGIEYEIKMTGDIKSNATAGGIITAVHGPHTQTPQTAKEHRGSPIKKGHMVLSLSSRALDALPPLQKGDAVSITCTVSDEVQNAALLLGGGRPDGGPMLLINGQTVPADTTVDDYLYFYARHARTALGIREDGTYFFLSAPQDESAASDGITVEDLTAFLRYFGAHTALNLDGGPSSAFLLPSGKYLNPVTTIFGELRDRETAVSNVLVLTQKSK